MCAPPTVKKILRRQDSINLIQTNAASDFLLCIHPLSHCFTFQCVPKRVVSGYTVKEPNEPARDRERTLSCHPSWHKWLPVFAFNHSPPNPAFIFPSMLPSLVFPLFSIYPLFCLASWVPRPFVWPCLTFPSSAHSHIRTSLYLLPYTLTGHHTCVVWRQKCPWHNYKWVALSFLRRDKLAGGHSTIDRLTHWLTLLDRRCCSYAVDDSRNRIHVYVWPMHFVNVQKWCNHCFTGSNGLYCCHDSRKCLCVLLEVRMLCAFALVGEFFRFSSFPTSAWLNGHEFTNPVHCVFMWWCSVFTMPIIHSKTKCHS